MSYPGTLDHTGGGEERVVVLWYISDTGTRGNEHGEGLSRKERLCAVWESKPIWS